MARGRTILTVVAFAAFCLALAYWWTIRAGIPLTGPRPWWFGKNAFVRVQVVEPGHDLATVSMKLPKGAMDALMAFDTNATVTIGDHHHIVLRDYWRELQRLPRGQKLEFKEEDATITIWIEAMG